MQDIQENLIRLKYRIETVSSNYDISPYLDDIHYLLIDDRVKLYNYPDKYISINRLNYKYTNIDDIIDILNDIGVYPMNHNSLKRKYSYEYNSNKRIKI
jgi:hypothetical protein